MDHKKRVAKFLRSRMSGALIVLFLTVISHGVSAQVVISEFMAKNDETLIDGDGNYSDWIELCNLGESAVDLTGWYLSDDDTDLTQWTFPSKSIGAGEFLVVFASGQETAGYTDSLGYLHTNFKLSSDAEDIVLTQSDGTTIEDSFLDYPEQDDDISYGLDQDSSANPIVAAGEDAAAYVGSALGSGTSWRTPAFDDSTWTSGTTGVGYDEESTYTSADIGLNLESQMVSTTQQGPQTTTTYESSAYIRVPFSLSDASGISQLALRMKYDDGFVAYINGTEVASANAPDTLTYASEATASNDGTTYEDYILLNAGDYLVTGDNVLAIQGLAYLETTTEQQGRDMITITSSPDFYIMPVLNSIIAGEIYTNTAVYLSTPTPGGDNVQGFLGYVADTTFSVDRGFFSALTNVEISCKTEDAAIYYTTDATEPSEENGTLYTGPITISKTTVLRATATKAGYMSSDIDTQTYFFLDDIIAQGTDVSGLDPEFPSGSVNGQGFDYGMDTDITQSSTYSSQIEGALLAIPSISIVTDPDNLFSPSSGIYVNASEGGEAWERETSIELINPDGADGFQINGGMRMRGASSTTSGNPKHSFRFFFRSEYGTSRLEYPLFGEDGADSFKRMDLRTGQNFSWANQTPAYATWLYDIFTRDTHRDMGQPYTAGEYYHLYINGMYWGLYQTEERCESNFAESYYGDDADDFDAVKADADTGDMYAVDGTRDAYDDLWAAVYSGVSGNAAYFAIQGMNADGTDNSSYTKLLDVDNVIDYMLLVYFTGNRDSPVGPPQNTPTMPRNLTAIYNRTNPDGFKFVAHDNEHSLEVSQGVSHNRFNTTLSSSFDAVDRFNPWSLNLKLMANEEYALRFADHVHEHFFNGGNLTASVTANRLEVRKNEIYAAVVAESARWGDSAGSLRTRDVDWLNTVNWLTDTYMLSRTATVLSQIVAKGWYPTVAAPEFNQHGGSIDSGFALSITGSGTVYYTTDGSDPRAVGGAVAGTAGTALTLTKSTQVKARVLSGGVWSALTKATFVINEESPLRVTELMYHPAAASPEAEFIEILNTGSETVGLAGTEFSNGIQFDFTDGDVASLAAGEYAVLVSDYDAFTNRYFNWASINIAGTYHGKFFIADGSLDNAGEQITLVDGLGNTILDFEYNDWYATTDGEGFSLTLIDPTAETSTWSESTSWRASKYTGGTPGEGPADFLSPGDLLINEALTHQDDDTPGDWVELYNASTNTLDINGWFLSDNENYLGLVELSGLDSIGPGEYLVLTEYSDFGTTSAAGTNGFGLSELGEGIYLSSGEGGVLTGYRVEESFGAAERDVTFGRHEKSDGTADFTAQSAQTMGALNGYPLIGDVVFSEIMYHPVDGAGFEFIEICNASTEDVNLYHATETSNAWKLEGAVEFTFPVGLTLAAGECLVITETNAAAFLSYYSVDAGVTVLGPYDGQLNNDGEDLYLTRPGDEEALTGEIPYIVVERVEYNDVSPWPLAADGLGASLERANAALYPNDVANWTVNTSPSPGTAAFNSDDTDSDGMPDAWEIDYFGSINAAYGGADDDWDLDGISNYDEYFTDTDPTDPDSVFALKAAASGSDCVLSWASFSGRVYTLLICTDLINGSFTETNSPIVATPPLNTFTIGIDSAECAFFRLMVEDE
ncbi:lamin tail domain-containing protein [Pontiellaceae bacterium B1224]|nr:lamin tail domain-containing protein [Pontiellaceae bacterium B1224]